jgi:hypothetical protein
MKLTQKGQKMKKTSLLCLALFATALVANAVPLQDPASTRNLSLSNKFDLPQAPQFVSESSISVPAVTVSAAEPLVTLTSDPNPYITPGKDEQAQVPETGATASFLATSLVGLAGLGRLRRK